MANLVGGLTTVVTWEREISYNQVEAALIGVGFTEYLIDRRAVPGQTEVTISVHIPMKQISAEGVPDFDAVTVMRSLADALADVDSST